METYDDYKKKLVLPSQYNHVFTKKLYYDRKTMKKMLSNPVQVLDHQEVRYPKDHSHRKDHREKRTRSQTTFMAPQYQQLVRQRSAAATLFSI